MIDFELTPIEKRNNIWLKRDDLFEIAGVCGGKARTCWHLAQNASGLVSAGARESPQAIIVAAIAKELNIPCQIHMPWGEYSPEMEYVKNLGAEIIQHKPGYNNILTSHAHKNAKKLGWTEIPFGMECDEAINQTRKQVKNIPGGVKRIVIPVGSGMSLAGLLWGLFDQTKSKNVLCYTQEIKIRILGIVVGANPVIRLNKYAPPLWYNLVELKSSDLDYHQKVENNQLEDVILDPIYEAKCLEYLEAEDLLWIVGRRPQ